MPIEHVRPGDVITSEFINQLLDRIEAMDQRLIRLETEPSASDQIRIENFEPPLQVEAGQVLTLLGKNFAYPPKGNIIKIDSFIVPQDNIRSDSTSAQLKFIVPRDLKVPEAGRNYNIRVETNSRGATQRGYRLLPALDVIGDPPEITSIVRNSDDSSVLRIGEVARITGSNFAANPKENRITFIIYTPTTRQTYPLPGQPLVIDEANSNTNQILVTVPNIVEIDRSGNFPVTVEVLVGAHPPAVEVVSIRRPVSP
jgi:hypothetical protein